MAGPLALLRLQMTSEARRYDGSITSMTVPRLADASNREISSPINKSLERTLLVSALEAAKMFVDLNLAAGRCLPRNCLTVGKEPRNEGDSNLIPIALLNFDSDLNKSATDQ